MLGRPRQAALLGLALLALAGTARAAFDDECRHLARQLATDPGSLKIGELDLLKSCVSDVQRGIVLGNPPPPKVELPVCTAPPPVAAPACPVCPPAVVCPRVSAPAPAPRADDRRLKPYLPTY